MNVKITYTVPFDEVPDKLEKLVQGSISKELLSNIQYFTVSKSNPAVALQELDYLRRALGSLDLLYQDVSAILAGYCEELDKVKNGEQV
jgi:hypothetical protein